MRGAPDGSRGWVLIVRYGCWWCADPAARVSDGSPTRGDRRLRVFTAVSATAEHPKPADHGADRPPDPSRSGMSSIPLHQSPRPISPDPSAVPPPSPPACSPVASCAGHGSGGCSPTCTRPRCSEVDLALRARAAGLLVAGRGAVAGYAAAELWGASCAPADEPVHVLHDRTTTAATGCASTATTSTSDETVPIDSGGVDDSGPHGVRPRSLGARSSPSAWSPRRPRACCGADLDAVRALRHRLPRLARRRGHRGGTPALRRRCRVSDGDAGAGAAGPRRPATRGPVPGGRQRPPIPARPGVSGAADRGGVRRCGAPDCRLGRAATSCARRT